MVRAHKDLCARSPRRAQATVTRRVTDRSFSKRRHQRSHRNFHLLTKTTPYSYGSAQHITVLPPAADQPCHLQGGYERLSWGWLRA